MDKYITAFAALAFAFLLAVISFDMYKYATADVRTTTIHMGHSR